MTFQTEFPDFPMADMPTIPATWSDQSWHNDSCPCFNTNAGLLVYVDYADTSLREFAESDRFTVHSDPKIANACDVLFSSDDWSAVITFLARHYGQAIVDVWAAWSDETEAACEAKLDVLVKALRAIDLHQVDGVISSPLNYFVMACLDDHNPEDLTYVEMVDAIALALTL